MAAGAAGVLVPLLRRRRVAKAATLVLLRLAESTDAHAVATTPGTAPPPPSLPAAFSSQTACTLAVLFSQNITLFSQSHYAKVVGAAHHKFST